MAQQSKEKDSMSELEDILGNIADLPTLPTVVMQINSMASDPQTNAADIGKVISNDASLSSKILKLVNSAYYGFPRKINSVTKAIVLLGFNKVKNIAISASVVDAFKSTGKLDGFDFYDFWEHSLATAIAAECVARECMPEVIDDAFVGGLLHDLGKVVMVNHTPETVAVFQKARENKCTFAEASKEVLDFDQAKVGSLLAEHWNFPETLVRTIRYWPYPQRTRQTTEVISCVHVANIVSSAMGSEAPGDYSMPVVNQEAWELLKLNEEVLAKIMRDAITGLDNASAFLELAK